MANRCEICGKHPVSGHNVSHSKRHTKRRWLPNVQRHTLLIDGVLRQIKICTRCLRTQQKTVA